MQGIDSEQPLESPPVSVQMPQSPINKFDGSLNGDDDSFPQSPMYEEKVQPNSSKVKDVCHYLEFKIKIDRFGPSSVNDLFCTNRGEMNFCTLRANELVWKERKKSVCVEKRHVPSFLLKNWHWQLFPELILILREGSSPQMN